MIMINDVRSDEQHQVLRWTRLSGVHRKLVGSLVRNIFPNPVLSQVRPALQTRKPVPAGAGGDQHRVHPLHPGQPGAEEDQHQQQESRQKGGIPWEEADQNYYSWLSRSRRCGLDKGRKGCVCCCLSDRLSVAGDERCLAVGRGRQRDRG